MLNRRHMFKTAAAAIAAAFIASSAPALAGTGSVRLRFVSAGFIIGLGGGEGTLTFHGQRYPLRIGGVSLGTFGASGGTLVGRALHLHNPTDIVGTFSAVGAGVAIAGGAQVIRMRNSNGVVLELHGMQAGFAANIGVSGFSLGM
ncbi:hypothetical protein K9U39_15770 [Rhodoblastus acidophilus]|uniref:Uncharacterized protein n=1 Tax=Candidatus Rhodoblastus alkanivorans TaxID=2954117 RepID=A0ABS9Z2B4_9HYPH|nr:hypothetical protein [Candidatus Rhodoblastus alkanivorans]MCI4678580.1 hypothetical protein [Candidatus Rhodoblastus alkanivorans]MCI4681332.1 hypothetical protein [Candidatus Rhodoblastus alkanivorans]MDI4642379.1 hypothetical protein [Rhodoblastus acidophilus]